jgi:uncharacterized membrane-anchored protein
MINIPSSSSSIPAAPAIIIVIAIVVMVTAMIIIGIRWCMKRANATKQAAHDILHEVAVAFEAATIASTDIGIVPSRADKANRNSPTSRTTPSFPST